MADGAGPCTLPMPLAVPLPASCAVIPLYPTPSMECRRVVLAAAVAAEADVPPAKGAVSPLYDTPSRECRRVVLAAADGISNDDGDAAAEACPSFPDRGAVMPLYDTPSIECRRGAAMLLAAADETAAAGGF